MPGTLAWTPVLTWPWSPVFSAQPASLAIKHKVKSERKNIQGLWDPGTHSGSLLSRSMPRAIHIQRGGCGFNLLMGRASSHIAKSWAFREERLQWFLQSIYHPLHPTLFSQPSQSVWKHSPLGYNYLSNIMLLLYYSYYLYFPRDSSPLTSIGFSLHSCVPGRYSQNMT